MKQNTASSIFDPAAYNKTLFPTHTIHHKCMFIPRSAVYLKPEGINLLSYNIVWYCHVGRK